MKNQTIPMVNIIFKNLSKGALFLILFFSAPYLSAQTPLQISTTVTQPDCNIPGDLGSISVTASGGTSPYTYEWQTSLGGSVFSTSPSVSGLASNSYSIKVTDANNDYAKKDSIQIINDIKGYLYLLSDADCPLANGSAGVDIYGGNAPFSYTWSNGSTSSTATNLAGGTTIMLQAQDVNGCDVYFYNKTKTYSLIGEVEIWMNSGIYVNYTTTPEQCPLNNGTITLNPSGGTPPYTYYWDATPASNVKSLTNLASGIYLATVTDANNCYKKASIYVNINPGTLSVTASKTNDHCTTLTGTAALTISGGVPPYSVQWPDGSSALSRNNLGYGNYNVDVTDQNGCVFHRLIFIDDISPVSAYVATTETDCTNNSGNALVNVSGGAVPYTYQWSNGATTASLSNLSTNYYSVLVKDANGCKAVSWGLVDIDNNCYGYISGKIFQDNDGNCVQDAGDYSIMNNWAYTYAAASPASLYDHYSYTGFTGQYISGYVLPDQYTVNFNDNIRTAACPVTGKYNISIPVSGVNYPNKDFAIVPASLFEDAAIVYVFGISDPRPGFNYSYNLSYKNNGTVPSDGYIEVVYGDLETFVSSSPAADFYDPTIKTLRFNYSSLMLGEIRSMQLVFNLPPATLLGSTYTHSVTANINGTDPTPSNNLLTYPFTVVGSFDPNDLKVFPKGAITEEDSVLFYAIRFQNTGTYPAELVVIKDTLDANLDISTISDITASHDFKFKVLESRAIEFAFEDINLPDSIRNEKDSHGFVNFSIKKKKLLTPGTQIKNKAEIYFDFNEPVVTNTTINTVAQLTDIKKGKKSQLAGKVYPNPARYFTEFSFEKEITSVQLMNSAGIIVMREAINKQKEFRLDLTLSTGMYFYKAVDVNGNPYSGKLIIE